LTVVSLEFINNGSSVDGWDNFYLIVLFRFIYFGMMVEDWRLFVVKLTEGLVRIVIGEFREDYLLLLRDLLLSFLNSSGEPFESFDNL